MKMLLALILTAAISLQASELRLTDGQTFQNWSVISQTDTTVTIKHSKGGAKIPKSLLPLDLLAKYPVTTPQPWIPPKLPAEAVGLDHTTKCQRSIELADVEASDHKLRWTAQAAEHGNRMNFWRTSSWGKIGDTKTDWLFFMEDADLPALTAGFDKALSWAKSVHQDQPPPFEKNMGKILDSEWKFTWSNGQASVDTGLDGVVSLSDLDIEQIEKLLKSYPHMLVERIQQNEAATNYASSLK